MPPPADAKPDGDLRIVAQTAAIHLLYDPFEFQSPPPSQASMCLQN
jgi:hypothetical protein